MTAKQPNLPGMPESRPAPFDKIGPVDHDSTAAAGWGDAPPKHFQPEHRDAPNNGDRHGWQDDGRSGRFMLGRECPIGTIHKWKTGWMVKHQDGWVPLEKNHPWQGHDYRDEESLTEAGFTRPHDSHRTQEPEGHDLNGPWPTGTYLASFPWLDGGTGLAVPVKDGSDAVWAVPLDGDSVIRPAHARWSRHHGIMTPSVRVQIAGAGQRSAKRIRAAAEQLHEFGALEVVDASEIGQSIGRLRGQISDALKDILPENVKPEWIKDEAYEPGDPGLFWLTKDEARFEVQVRFDALVGHLQGDPIGKISIIIGGKPAPIWHGSLKELQDVLAGYKRPKIDTEAIKALVSDPEVQALLPPPKPPITVDTKKPKKGAPPAFASSRYMPDDDEVERVAQEYAEADYMPLSEEEHKEVFGKLPFDKAGYARLAYTHGYKGNADIPDSEGHYISKALDYINKDWLAGRRLSFSENDLIRLAGIPDDWGLTSVHTGKWASKCVVSLEASPMNGDGTHRVTLTFKRNGGVEIYTDLLENSGGGAVGPRMVLTQSQAALELKRRTGMTPEMHLTAAGNLGHDHWIGYWVWAHLGFTQDGQVGPHGETFEELMSTPGGAAWWKAHGRTWNANFDLRPGSYSLARMYWYARHKFGMKSGSNKPQRPIGVGARPGRGGAAEQRKRQHAAKIREWLEEFTAHPRLHEQAHAALLNDLGDEEFEEFMNGVPMGADHQEIRRGVESILTERLNAEREVERQHRVSTTQPEALPEGVSVEEIEALTDASPGGYTDSDGRLHREAHHIVRFPSTALNRPVAVRVWPDGSHVGYHGATPDQVAEALRLAARKRVSVSRAARLAAKTTSVSKAGGDIGDMGDDDLAYIGQAHDGWCKMISERRKAVAR